MQMPKHEKKNAGRQWNFDILKSSRLKRGEDEKTDNPNHEK